MRRAQILVVILALLATPLALLARSMSCESSTCATMCCLPHSHSQQGQSLPCHCSAKQKHLPDFGLISIIAPTIAEQFSTVHAPDAGQPLVLSQSQSTLLEFASEPFNPPRS